MQYTFSSVNMWSSSSVSTMTKEVCEPRVLNVFTRDIFVWVNLFTPTSTSNVFPHFPSMICHGNNILLGCINVLFFLHPYNLCSGWIYIRSSFLNKGCRSWEVSKTVYGRHVKQPHSQSQFGALQYIQVDLSSVCTSQLLDRVAAPTAS